MALLGPVATVQRPNQQNQAGDPMALAIAQYGGIVEGTIERTSVLTPHVSFRAVRGTNTITNYAVGKATLGKVVAGEAPEPFKSDVSRKSLTVDTLVYARDMVPLLDEFQTAYDCRAEFGREHGKELAKFIDQSLFIQAIKAAQLTSSAYDGGSAGKPAGHFGGSQQVLANAADALDPALLYDATKNLFVKMEGKDVIPRADQIVLAMRPEYFYTLQAAEEIVNGEYITADGTTAQGMVFKAYGCPVVSSNNVPNTNITSHLLGASFQGDFSKVVAVAFSQRAILCGETIPLTSDAYYDKVWKSHFIDSHIAFGATTNRAEYAGVILKP